MRQHTHTVRCERSVRTVAACSVLVLCAMFLYAPIVAGQTERVAADSTSSNDAPPHSAPWFTKRDGVMFGAAVVATFAIAPLDHPISSELAEPNWHDDRPLQRTAKAVAFFGGDGPFIASGIVYGAGALLHQHAVAMDALQNLAAISLAATLTGVAKGLSGRALPGVRARHAFSFGRGFHDDNGPFVSFPSGHTAAAFAVATTLSDEIGDARPDLAPLATKIALTGATAVGVARVFQRMHWPSDLPLAAAIGVWSGSAMHAHLGSHSSSSKLVRGLTFAPSSEGRFEIGWSSLAAVTP